MEDTLIYLKDKKYLPKVEKFCKAFNLKWYFHFDFNSKNVPYGNMGYDTVFRINENIIRTLDCGFSNHYIFKEYKHYFASDIMVNTFISLEEDKRFHAKIIDEDVFCTLDYVEEDAKKVVDLITKSKSDLILDLHFDIASFISYNKDKFTLSGLEKITGISQGQLSHYLNGTSRPSKKNKDKFIKAIHDFGETLKTIELK